METKHINHVVLYAKNFYRHTGDLVKDLQRFCQIDGVEYYKVKTPEKLLSVMMRNYKMWVYSLKDKQQKNFLLEELKKEDGAKVAWCDDPVLTKLWYLMIMYSGSRIPMRVLEKPAYDKFHLPQYCIKEHLFKKNDSFDTMIAAADKYMHQTQLTVLDKSVNDVLFKLNYKEIINSLKELAKDSGEQVPGNQEEVEDEIWNAYEDFVEKHKSGSDDVQAGNFTVTTPHFILQFCLSNGDADFSVYIKFGSVKKEIQIEKGKDLKDVYSGLIDQFIQHDFSGILGGHLNSARMMIGDDSDFNDDRLSVIFKEYKNHLLSRKDAISDTIVIGFLGTTMIITRAGDNLRGEFLFDSYLDCAIQEQALVNYKAKLICSEKY